MQTLLNHWKKAYPSILTITIINSHLVIRPDSWSDLTKLILQKVVNRLKIVVREVRAVTPVTTSLRSRVFNQYRNVIHHEHCNMSIWILDENAVELPKVSSVIFGLQVRFKQNIPNFVEHFLSSLIYSVGFRDTCEIPCYWFNPMNNNHFVLVYSFPMLSCVFSPYDLPPQVLKYNMKNMFSVSFSRWLNKKTWMLFEFLPSKQTLIR